MTLCENTGTLPTDLKNNSGTVQVANDYQVINFRLIGPSTNEDSKVFPLFVAENLWKWLNCWECRRIGILLFLLTPPRWWDYRLNLHSIDKHGDCTHHRTAFPEFPDQTRNRWFFLHNSPTKIWSELSKYLSKSFNIFATILLLYLLV